MASPISQIPFPSPLSDAAVDADAEGLVEAVSRKFEWMFSTSVAMPMGTCRMRNGQSLDGVVQALILFVNFNSPKSNNF